MLEDEAEWLLKEKAPTADLRLNYFAVANAGSLSVKISRNFKFLGQKIGCSTYNTRHQISLILRMLSSELYKIMVNKVTLVGFKGAIPPLGFAPVVTGIMVRSTPEIRFLPGQLR